jgi:hypothetical protein
MRNPVHGPWVRASTVSRPAKGWAPATGFELTSLTPDVEGVVLSVLRQGLTVSGLARPEVSARSLGPKSRPEVGPDLVASIAEVVIPARADLAAAVRAWVTDPSSISSFG